MDDTKYKNEVVAPRYSDDDLSIGKGDILGGQDVDPVLTAKMNLVNNALNEISRHLNISRRRRE
ncbi:Filamentous Growth Regulator [Recurvomyces mirabilis]|uniref:Filamentous Growth Regulator n=1 Tax=Recurvomyces mirabilis TaxID=574656 RepID=A0AAE0WII2_9PEZI|nr:Filamentous Growth Regulator [Recurvomyces mirabilis]